MRRDLRRVLGVSLAWLCCAVAAVHAADDTRPNEPAGAETRLSEVLVEAPPAFTAASSDEIRARDFETRPHETLQEILNNVPGLIVRQHQGGGKATQYLVRGFNADHGTDFAVSVDGLPVNLVTHAHGQGYADLNFVIPETIDRLQLWKGPYFAHLGDLATAGGLNLVTKERFDESFVLAEGGSFDRMRYVAGLSPKLGNLQTLFAGQAYYSNGPFDHPEHFARYNAYGKLTLAPTEASKLWLAGTVYAADWDASGQIPAREVSAGRLDRFGAIDPTEGGRTDRENLDVHYDARLSPNDRVAFQLYASRYKLRLWSDFTFFQDFYADAGGTIFRTPEAPIGPGRFQPASGIEQNDRRWLYGAKASWTRAWTLAGLPLESALAFETRHDDVDVAVYRQLRRDHYFTLTRTYVEERSVSAWWSQSVFLTDWLRFEGGLRGDWFSFDVDDRLPANDSLPRSTGGRMPGDGPFRIHARASDGIVSPKANLVVTPHPSTEIYLNFGNGFHSNDARAVAQAKQADDRRFEPLVQSLGYELGARTRQLADRLDLAASLWLVDLESEVVFCGDCGTIEATGTSFDEAGPTRRWGIDFEARWQLTRWLAADYDLSYADPRFKNGDAIPIAPTLFMNGGLTANLGNGFEAAFRVRFLDDRPAIEDRSLPARGYLVMDVLAKYRWRNVEASLGLLNLGDVDWQEAVFADTSLTKCELTGRCRRDDRPDIHFTPGDPFGVRAGLKVFF
jgi:outer membrane receptor protein involved in Fe transport